MWNNKIKLTVISCIVAAALLCSGCGRRGGGMPAMPPPEVSTISVKTEKIVLTTELPGRITAYLVAEVRPQVGGIIQKRFFEEGSEVKEGDILNPHLHMHENGNQLLKSFAWQHSSSGSFIGVSCWD